MNKEPTNDDLLAKITSCALSSVFNENDYGKPAKSNLDSLVKLRAERFTFMGIDDFIVRSEVDRYIKENTK